MTTVHTEHRSFDPPVEADMSYMGVQGDPYRSAHVERIRAHEKHDHPASPSMERRPFDDPCWLSVLTEEVGEVAMAINDHRHSSKPSFAKLKAEVRKEVVQVMAMAAAWIDAIDADLRDDEGQMPDPLADARPTVVRQGRFRP